MPKRLVSISAAAEYADVHPRTIRRQIAAGRITAYRVGSRLIKIDLNELEASFQPVGAGTGRRSVIESRLAELNGGGNDAA